MVGNDFALLHTTIPDFSLLPGGWQVPEDLIPSLDDQSQIVTETLSVKSAQILRNVLSSLECRKLIQLMEQSPKTEGVSIQGRKDIPNYQIGSVRTTLWAPQLAVQLWTKILELIPVKHTNAYTATDWWQGDINRKTWEPFCVSPLLRFMKYERGGQHFAHYDAGFIYPDDNYRTLQSIVIYLTTVNCGGATRFIQDSQQNIPIWERNHLDWTREAASSEVLAISQPQAGSILVFDHRECHDVEIYSGEHPRIVIRGDIIYRSVL